MSQPLIFSRHAMRRMAQRRLTTADVDYVVQHGRRLHTAGVVCCFLGRRELALFADEGGRYDYLEGTTVLLDRETNCTVVTVYRNRAALKKMHRKARYGLKTQPAAAAWASIN